MVLESALNHPFVYMSVKQHSRAGMQRTEHSVPLGWFHMDKAGQAAWVRGPRQADSHNCPPSRGVKPFCPALVITTLMLSHFILSVFPFLVAGLGEGLATRYGFDFLL